MAQEQLTVSVSAEVKQRLRHLARVTGRSMSNIVETLIWWADPQELGIFKPESRPEMGLEVKKCGET